LGNPKVMTVSSTGPMCVVTPMESMQHKYELLLENYKVNNVLPDSYVSTCILVESISVITSGEPTFGMPSLSLNLKVYFGIPSLSLNFF
jgi:hypothetical protein